MIHKWGAQLTLFVIFAFLICCVATFYEIEEARERGERIEQDLPVTVQGIRITEPYRVFRFVNQHGYIGIFGESGEESLCGLSNEDFLAYLEWRTRDMDVILTVPIERYFPGREICLKEAWVFVRKND